MHRWLLGTVLVAGCAGATPVAEPKALRWSMPMVGPLEGGHVLVPARVNGKGPYLFALDPDAPVSAVDLQIVDEAGLFPVPGPPLIDEAGHAQPLAYAQLHDLVLGELTVPALQVISVSSNVFNVEGRRVHGVIGRDVIAKTLIYSFDRDHGLVTLETRTAFQPRAGAIELAYRRVDVDASARPPTITESPRPGALPVDATPVQRRVIAAELGGAHVQIHLDLGEPVSQLRAPQWPRAQLTARAAELRLVDEAATVRMLTRAAPADAAIAGGRATGRVRVVPYVDQRFALGQLDGTLGLDFFRGYAVSASWGDSRYYLRPRAAPEATTNARLGRWGAAIPACPDPGCARATLREQGLALDIVRDPQAAGVPLELYLAISAPGQPAHYLLAELPPGVDTITGESPEDFGDAAITVLDVAPFVRPCAVDGAGCVFPAPSDAN